MDNLNNLTMEQLKQKLNDLGAKKSGSKQILINRLHLWQTGVLNKKLYRGNIVPAVDVNNFPTEAFEEIDVNSEKTDLQWLSTSIIADWFIERRASVGDKKGRKLFFNDFIKKIKVCRKFNDIYFKGVCSAETKKNVDYVVRIHLNSSMCQILKANCDCPAGTGLSAACKHISATLYAIECFVVSGKVPTCLSSTSKAQKWHRPTGRSLENMTINKMLGISETTHQQNSDITNYAINSLINFKTESPFLASRNANLSVYCADHDYCQEKLQYYMLNNTNKVSAKEIKRIEKNTRVHNRLWYQVRSSRITASICHSAIRTTNSGRFADSFLKNHVRGVPIFANSIKWGLSNEPVARKKYCQVTGNKIKDCGIFIDHTLNFLAATPDGINLENNLIIEIKCPYSVRKGLPTDVKYISKNGLFRSHPYYYQIQLQKHVTGIPKCDFVVWTPQSLYIERIEYDAEFAKKMLDKLTLFYKTTFCDSYYKFKY